MIDYESYRVGEANDIMVLELEGRLDMNSSTFLLDCIQGVIEDEGVQKIILDCTQLVYISSMGLGSLVRAHSRLQGQKGSVALAGVQGIVAEVLAMTHLDRIFHMFPTVKDAADALDAN